MQPSAEQQQRPVTGRASFYGLCHNWDEMCPQCLRQIAELMANEIDWSLSEALDRPIESYRAEFVCLTLEQARELRRFTVAACLRVEHDRIGIPLAGIDSVILADEVVKVEGGELMYAEAQAA